MRRLDIYEHVGSRHNNFCIVETYDTVDGPRSRISGKRFPSLEAAQRFVEGAADGTQSQKSSGE